MKTPYRYIIKIVNSLDILLTEPLYHEFQAIRVPIFVVNETHANIALRNNGYTLNDYELIPLTKEQHDSYILDALVQITQVLEKPEVPK